MQAIDEARIFNANLEQALAKINDTMADAKQQILFEKGIAILQIRNAQWEAISAIRAEAGAIPPGADGATLGATDPLQHGYTIGKNDTEPI